MTKEEKLQADVVLEFNNRHPNLRRQLIHVSNERNNKFQAFKARSIGIVPGVADMLFFSKSFNVATELKVPGSRHDVSRIRSQMKWGKLWEKLGNTWRMCTTVEEAVSCYEGNFKGKTVNDVKKLLKGVKTKTIKID